MKKSLFIVSVAAAIMLLFTGKADAQTVTKSNDFSAFTAIEASYNYEITVKESSEYKVEWTVDTLLENLVEIYQKGSTLFIGFNEKGMSKDIKKHYKGKNAPVPILKVTVYTPELSAVSLSGNAHLEASAANFNSDSFAVTMKDKSKLTTLKVNAKSAIFDLTGESSVNADFVVSKITVKADKKANLILNQESDQINLKTKGSSVIAVYGNAGQIAIESEGSSKVTLEKGSSSKINLTSKGSAELDAVSYQIKVGEISLAGAKAYLNVVDEIKLNLKKDSVVSYVDDPIITIVNVERATISHYKGKK